MIPKIIHYCWFGRGPMPELAQKCIASWQKILPEYEYRLWNEDSFDVNSVDYVSEAYQARKYAFVTDYVRLWALYNFGGVYMDTDVEILKPLDKFLDLPAFTGYEASNSMSPVTGLMASAANGVWVKEQLMYYTGKHFKNKDGSLDLTSNTITISRIMCENGFQITGNYGVYKDDMHVFPVDYFCPLTSTRVLKLTENTHCIHHFAGSWQDKTIIDKLKIFLFRKVLGVKLTDRLIMLKRKLKSN